MNDILNTIELGGIVPVIKIKDANDAEGLADALHRSGIPAIEVTFRTACAKEAIRIMAGRYPDMLVGAGTVLTTAQVDEAIKAGAKFIVSPGLNPSVVTYCEERNIPVIPGIASPSEIERALELGLTTLKFFPCEALGGTAMLKAMSAPYGNIRFMPTGGISESNLCSYLRLPNVIACGGSYMVKDSDISAHSFDKIEKLTSDAINAMLDLHVISIESSSDSSALKILSAILGFSTSVSDCLPEETSVVLSSAFPERARFYLSRNAFLNSKQVHIEII